MTLDNVFQSHQYHSVFIMVHYFPFVIYTEQPPTYLRVTLVFFNLDVKLSGEEEEGGWTSEKQREETLCSQNIFTSNTVH